MIYDPVFQAILGGTLVALGIAGEHMRIRFALWRKRRRRVLGASYRPEPQAVWSRWTPEIGRGLRR